MISIPKVKLLSGTLIPKLGLGTWLIGGDHNGKNPNNNDDGQIKEDLDLFTWKLEKEDMEKLTKDFPIQIRISDCSEPRVFKV